MKLPLISLSREQLSNFEEAIGKEWISTNGLGGYASSTALGINTRKYHGLLVAAFHPPGDRRVCLAKLDEEISVGKNVYPLGANEFQNEIFPKGYLFLKEFSASPFPTYTYSVQNLNIQKTIFMPHKKNAVIITYNVLNKGCLGVDIRVFPLVTCRHIHSVVDRWKNPLEFIQKQDDKELEIGFGAPKSTLIIVATSGRYFATGKWVERIYFREEASRGESYLDDWYQPGCFKIHLKANTRAKFAITVVSDEDENFARKVLAEMPTTMYDVETLYEKETERCSKLITKFYETHGEISAEDWLNWIILAADAFIVEGVAGKRYVIAGYPWFEAWGRDTFISLPGLMLVTGRFEDARQVFLAFKKHYKEGLIPNYIPDQAEAPVYNAVDATLWYMNAVIQYLKYTGDFKFVKEQLWESLNATIENYVKGTAFSIHVDSDGLLSHGPQLTWMDVSINGQPITPRAEKAVEVQALWYNALKAMELLANKFKEKNKAEEYALLAEKAKKSFVEKFWDSEKGYLFDVVDGYGGDASLRPNQIFAVALDFTMLDDVKGERIVDVVRRELLTPYGLRTLARSDPKYIGVYIGDRRSRDKAYHNGTVWPWLLGPFTTAFLKTKGYAEYRREYALKNFLLPLFTKQIFEAGLGTLSEIFDGNPPHIARGCFAQAWSIAEPLRAYVEDVMQIRPKYEREILQNLR
jgi:predicted glycogen debranching enzyme